MLLLPMSYEVIGTLKALPVSWLTEIAHKIRRIK